MDFEFNEKGMRELMDHLSVTIAVPSASEASEADAMRAVRDEYKAKTGVDIDDATALEWVQHARNK